MANLSQDERGKSSGDGTKTDDVCDGATGEGRRRCCRTGDGASTRARGSDRAAVAAGQSKVGASEASGVARVDDNGPIAKKAAWSSSSGKIEVQETSRD